MSFIVLTGIEGSTIRISATWIEAYYREPNKSETFVQTSSDNFFAVKETPDDIDAMLIVAGVDVVHLDQQDKPKLVVFKGKT